MNSNGPAHVLIVDRQPVSRFGLSQFISGSLGLLVCGEVDSLAPAREILLASEPAILIIDPSIGDGLAFLGEIRARRLLTRSIVFSSATATADVQQAFRAGACGFVSRCDPLATMGFAIAAAQKGERFAGPEVERVLLANLASGTIELKEELSVLSERELQIFRLVGFGSTTGTIAESLRISVKTVETHRQRIKHKLKLKRGADLDRLARMQAMHVSNS